MELSLRELAALVAVLDTGSFTAAATELGSTQATVSRRLAALEQRLGTRLLERTTRTVTPTPAGLRVAEHARAVLTAAADLLRAAGPRRTEIRLGYTWSALGRHTRGVQRQWAAAHPDLPLVLVHQESRPDAGLADHTDGRVDAAVLRRVPGTTGPGAVRTADVGTERRYAALATDNPLARKRSVALADLLRWTVALDARTGTTTPALWGERAAELVVRRSHGVDEWLTLIAAGQAVGVTSEATAHQHPRPGIAYRVVRDAPTIVVRLGWRADDPPPLLDDLVDLVRAAYHR